VTQDTGPNARVQLAALYRELGQRRLCGGTAGNVSLRTDSGMIVTPSGAKPEAIAPECLASMSLGGHVQGGSTPSSEWAMHARIYEAYSGARCIVHTHSDACTALACLGEGLPAFHYMNTRFGGDDVRCAPYKTFGTPALAEAAVRALDGRTACLLANHGMVVHAGSPAEALSSALLLETLARQYLLARSAGNPRLLTAEEMREAQRRFQSYDAGRG
jgi:L-fuculose-phosphate aldolase